MRAYSHMQCIQYSTVENIHVASFLYIRIKVGKIVTIYSAIDRICNLLCAMRIQVSVFPCYLPSLDSFPSFLSLSQTRLISLPPCLLSSFHTTNYFSSLIFPLWVIASSRIQLNIFFFFSHWQDPCSWTVHAEMPAAGEVFVMTMYCLIC